MKNLIGSGQMANYISFDKNATEQQQPFKAYHVTLSTPQDGEFGSIFAVGIWSEGTNDDSVYYWLDSLSHDDIGKDFGGATLLSIDWDTKTSFVFEEDIPVGGPLEPYMEKTNIFPIIITYDSMKMNGLAHFIHNRIYPEQDDACCDDSWENMAGVLTIQSETLLNVYAINNNTGVGENHSFNMNQFFGDSLDSFTHYMHHIIVTRKMEVAREIFNKRKEALEFAEILKISNLL
jgi:hypothetical protein